MRKCFSKQIYLTTLRRYWAGGALLAVLSVLLTLAYHSNVSNVRYGQFGYMAETDMVQKSWEAGQRLLQAFVPVASVFGACAAIACAALVFSYLHGKRGSVMLHALPIRRETHFVSVFLGGLTLLWVPAIICAAGFAVVQMSLGLFCGTSVILALMLLLLATLAAYSFTAFAGFLAGSTFGQISVAGLLLGLPPLIEMFFYQLCRNFLFGFSGFTVTVNEYIHPVSVFYKLASRVSLWLPGSEESGLTAGVAGWLVFLLGYCAVFIAASLLLYRRRHLECAGDFIAVRGMRPVFRYGSAFLATYLFGTIGSLFHGRSVFFGSFYEGGVSGGWLLYSIVGGILGFFIAEGFIRKTVKVHRHWKGALLFTGCYLAVFFALFFDVFGYGGYVLPKDKVESVYLSHNSMPWEGSAEWEIKPIPYLFTGEDMDAALALQELIAREGKSVTAEWRAWTPDALGSPAPFAPDDDKLYMEPPPYQWRIFNLTATLTSGRTVVRNYQLYVPTGSAEWNAKIDALYEAAVPQRLEKLRNIGAAARRLEFTGYSWHHYSRDYRPLDRTLYGRDIEAFIAELVKDNLEYTNWDSSMPFEAVYYDQSGPTPLAEFLYIDAVIGEAEPRYHWANRISLVVRYSDDNALQWLMERNYLPDWLIEQYNEVLHGKS